MWWRERRLKPSSRVDTGAMETAMTALANWIVTHRDGNIDFVEAIDEAGAIEAGEALAAEDGSEGDRPASARLCGEVQLGRRTGGGSPLARALPPRE